MVHDRDQFEISNITHAKPLYIIIMSSYLKLISKVINLKMKNYLNKMMLVTM